MTDKSMSLSFHVDQESNSRVVTAMAKEWLRNTFQNSSSQFLYRGIEKWKPAPTGQYVQPIIVGSGPSLIADIEKLRHLTWITKPFIISTYSSVSFLMHHGITPDAIILADSSASVMDRWNLFEDYIKETEWTWVCAQHVDPKIAEYASLSGKLYTWKSFLKPETDSRAGIYNTAVEAMCPYLKTFMYQVGDSGNAAILLLENLRNFGQLKFSSIILCGVDHSWNSEWYRVPYFTEKEIVPTTGWQTTPMQEELSSGLFTNIVLKMYNEELKNIAGIMEERGIKIYTTSKATLVGRSIPQYAEGDL